MKTRLVGILACVSAVICFSSSSYAITIGDNDVRSKHIMEADNDGTQNTNSGWGVKTNHIQDGAVNSAKILNGTILEEDLANGAVTEDKLSSEYKAVIGALEDRIAALELLLQHFSASESGDDVYITGANLHLRSGSGTTNGSVNGLGNLIIGYNEDPTYFTEDRTGSHNLVIGEGNNYSAYGGIVASEHSAITGAYSSAIGGLRNTVDGPAAVIVGSAFSTITSAGYQGAIVGGRSNYVEAQEGAILAGDNNHVTGWRSAIGGAIGITLSGSYLFYGGY